MSLLAHLADAVEDASRTLPAVERRRMFGCDAWFAAGTIYALVWKHGRIALKLPEPGAYEALLGLPGAAPWTAGSMKMSGWVMVPEGFHDDAETLRGWAERAHRLALAAPPKAAPKKAAKAAQVAAPKRAPAKTAVAPKKAGAARKPAAKRPAAGKRPARAK